jgi:uncharacterized protein YcaQ
MEPRVTAKAARRLLLHRQGLSHPPHRKLTLDGLRELITQMGFVQLDSINTVERAHHLVLFSRNQTYKHQQLKLLLERDGALFENWTHDAAIIPSAFFPFWRHRFARERERWRKRRGDGFEAQCDAVLERVRSDGPVLSRQFSGAETGNNPDNTKKRGGGWWDWHPSKTALEYHWRTGALAVARRDGFQKVYDLTKRVIPETHRGPAPDPKSVVDWACSSAVDRLGLATHGEIAAFWDLVSPDQAKAWCHRQLGQELEEVLIEQVNGGKPRRSYARPGLAETLRHLPDPPKRIRVLSPFDPVIRDRKRALRLFDFDYRIEVFVPAPKRKYGYYVFPLLEGDALIGRIDMKHDRQSGALTIKALWLEEGRKMTAGRLERLEAELERLRRFTGAERTVFLDGHLKR